jgi:hypothetical protein
MVFVVLSATPALAEWQIKPFVGVTFGGRTTFVDPELAAEHSNVAFGVSGLLLGEVFGVEGDFGQAPGFFQTGDVDLVTSSDVTTLSGNVVVALPRRLSQYTLRPYFVGGLGMMHVHTDDAYGVLVAKTLPAFDVGGGVTGFLSKRVGLSWDLRYFHSIGGGPEGGTSVGGAEQLSFWRANMAVAIRP